MLSPSSDFPQWDWIPVTTHSSVCHALRHFSMKHLSFFPSLLCLEMVCSLTCHCFLLPNYLSLVLSWIFNVTGVLSFSFVPNKEVLGRFSIPCALIACPKAALREARSCRQCILCADIGSDERPVPQPSEGQRLGSLDRCLLVPTTLINCHLRRQ